jgi:hypothetical protein
LDELKSFNVKNNKGTINPMFSNGKKEVINQYYKSFKVVRNVNFGIENNVIKLHGEILVPMSDMLSSKLLFTSANILDGGFVYISGVKSEYDINLNEYV